MDPHGQERGGPLREGERETMKEDIVRTTPRPGMAWEAYDRARAEAKAAGMSVNDLIDRAIAAALEKADFTVDDAEQAAAGKEKDAPDPAVTQ